jgi:hypothetical protein
MNQCVICGTKEWKDEVIEYQVTGQAGMSPEKIVTAICVSCDHKQIMVRADA